MPWPGGIKKEYENIDLQENKFKEEFPKNKPIELYRFLIEKIAELKFSLGEFMNNQENNVNSPILIYLSAFLILFTFGIGISFFRNNFKNSIQDKVVTDKSSIAAGKNQKVSLENIIQEIKKNPSNELKSIPVKTTAKNPTKFEGINKASPSLEEIRNLINDWLQNKSNFLAGKSEINLSKIAKNGLIDRTIEERQNDIKQAINPHIDSKIMKIDLESQTSSRIVVLVELNYRERIISNSGEIINETSLNPLKNKYILGFSNKSWKLVDFVSGL